MQIAQTMRAEILLTPNLRVEKEWHFCEDDIPCLYILCSKETSTLAWDMSAFIQFHVRNWMLKCHIRNCWAILFSILFFFSGKTGAQKTSLLFHTLEQ
jgi:hypothetical protein